MPLLKISKDTPISEITLRRYEKPYDLDRRELVRKLCLSSGLLQPGDSRDIIVDILYVLLDSKKENKLLSSEDVKSQVIIIRRQHNLALVGVASSNVRRQLKRLRDLFLVEKVRNSYRITEFDNVSVIFNEKIEQYLLASMLDRVREYCKKVDEEFS
jgi:DNA-binding transcriptional ArsR family regulator